MSQVSSPSPTKPPPTFILSKFAFLATKSFFLSLSLSLSTLSLFPLSFSFFSCIFFCCSHFFSSFKFELVYLVGVEFVAPTLEYMSNTSADSAKAVRDLISSGESLKELERLANAAGLRVVGSNRQKLDKPRPATLIGKGKAFQIRDEARQLGATTVFFDCELSPSQAKNLDKILNKKMPVESTRTYSTGSVSIGGGNFGIDFDSTSNLEET